MASIITGSIVAEIRGSVGTEAYSRNAFGAYVKARKSPTNPNTVAQQAARAVIASGVSAWQALSDAQRQCYIVEARFRSTKNRLGISTKLTGYHLFLRQFSLATHQGITPPVTISSPVLNATYELTGLNLKAQNFTAFGRNTGIVSTARVLLYGTPGRSPGQISFNPSTKRVLNVTSFPVSQTQLGINSVYATVFGSTGLLIGKTVTIGFATFNVASAEFFKPQYLSQLVAA